MLPAAPCLYLVTDPDMVPPEALCDVVRAAVRGGVDIVQLRDKRAEGRALVEAGRALKAALKPFGVPLIINDRVDVAQIVGAEGVHLGQSDLPCAEARALLGPEAILGLSVSTEAEAAAADGASYLAASPVYATPTKPDAPAAVGLAGVTRLKAARPELPLYAIGGLKADNLAPVIEAGADGICVVSAILANQDPEAAARALAAAIQNGERA